MGRKSTVQGSQNGGERDRLDNKAGGCLIRTQKIYIFRSPYTECHRAAAPRRSRRGRHKEREQGGRSTTSRRSSSFALLHCGRGLQPGAATERGLSSSSCWLEKRRGFCAVVFMQQKESICRRKGERIGSRASADAFERTDKGNARLSLSPQDCGEESTAVTMDEEEGRRTPAASISTNGRESRLYLAL
jgi:hypothetical protein